MGTTALSVQIVAVNEDGHQTEYNGSGDFCDGRDLPFLEERPGDEVWDAWGVTYRDVYVVDREGKLLEVFNLTDNDLGQSTNYDTLRQILVDAAGSAP